MRQTRHSQEAAKLLSQPMPFIGRSSELADIRGLLRRHNCRFLSLLGPGGIGKSRLAVELGALQAAHYAHGVTFVDLQPVKSVEFLVPAITNALGCPLTGQEDLLGQRRQYLKGNNLLLILDNFEQLLAENGGSILTDLLDAAQHVQLFLRQSKRSNKIW